MVRRQLETIREVHGSLGTIYCLLKVLYDGTPVRARQIGQHIRQEYRLTSDEIVLALELMRECKIATSEKGGWIPVDSVPISDAIRKLGKYTMKLERQLENELKDNIQSTRPKGYKGYLCY